VHIFNLEQTNFLLPHWYTEGLAVVNEGYPRPQIWNQLLVERVPTSLAAARALRQAAEHGHDPAHDPAVDHLERLHRRVLGDEHDAGSVVAQALHGGFVLCRTGQEGRHDVAVAGGVL